MPTTVLAALAEVVCSALVILGLWTRFAAFFVVLELGCVFVLAHKMALGGMRSGELPLVLLVSFLVLFLSGAGKYSFDRK